LITTSKQWLERLFLHSHGKRLASVSLDYDMVVEVDAQPLADGILASARPTVANGSMPLKQRVTLNTNALHPSSLLSVSLLNGQAVMKLVPVMIHEMLHGLGIASIPSGLPGVGWDSMLDASKTWYLGASAVQAYRQMVGLDVSRIPVENSFGAGTAYSHWEEGLRDGFVKETRTYDYGAGPIVHPSLPNEIMTGVAGFTFYLTPLTAGALEDHGYAVNWNSPSIGSYGN
jgi:hypothetical protein